MAVNKLSDEICNNLRNQRENKSTRDLILELKISYLV